MHLHLGTEHVKQVKGETDILCVAVEVDHYLVAAVLAGQVETWYVLGGAL